MLLLSCFWPTWQPIVESHILYKWYKIYKVLSKRIKKLQRQNRKKKKKNVENDVKDVEGCQEKTREIRSSRLSQKFVTGTIKIVDDRVFIVWCFPIENFIKIKEGVSRSFNKLQNPVWNKSWRTNR